MPLRPGHCGDGVRRRLSLKAPPMIFIVKKASDQDFEEKREIYSIAALMELAGGLEHELVLSRNLLKDHPVILICDGAAE
jgi:hypothetical protein